MMRRIWKRLVPRQYQDELESAKASALEQQAQLAAAHYRGFQVARVVQLLHAEREANHFGPTVALALGRKP